MNLLDTVPDFFTQRRPLNMRVRYLSIAYRPFQLAKGGFDRMATDSGDCNMVYGDAPPGRASILPYKISC